MFPERGIDPTTNVLEEILGVLTRLDELIDRSRDQMSSLTIEDMARGAAPKITTKVYGGDPLTREQINAILDAHGYANREAARRMMAGWAETLAELQAGR